MYKDTPAYRSLLDAWKIRGKPVVVWAGSGLSAPSGLPTWPALQKKLEEEAEAAIRGANDASAARRRALLAASRAAPSTWKSFEHLEESFGQSSFQSAITRQLQDALRCAIPPGYTQLWNLGVRGILTLNIDRLAHRAYLKSDAQDFPITERSGMELRELLGTLTDPQRRFIANLHGHLEDPVNWVFTERKLNALLKNEDYNELVRDCIKYCMIVLIGVTATDKAVLEHFRSARADHINIGPHFWLTATDDFDAIAAAESSGIQVIEYPNKDGKHSELSEIFRELKQFVPTADRATPVVWDPKQAGSGPKEALPEPSALISKTPNELRSLLPESVILNSPAPQFTEIAQPQAPFNPDGPAIRPPSQPTAPSIVHFPASSALNGPPGIALGAIGACRCPGTLGPVASVGGIGVLLRPPQAGQGSSSCCQWRWNTANAPSLAPNPITH